MLIHSVAQLVDALRQNHLLDEAHIQQLPYALLSRHADPRALAEELLRLGRLTRYQINHLFEGMGNELLLGSYVLLDKLGEGGMGQVFKARNRKSSQIVALKLIRKEKLVNEDAVRRFHREIRAATALRHPNVVHAFDTEEVNGRHLLVMEYVEGIDLAERVQQSGPLPPDMACDYVRQAAMGLQHAYERGLVHRDIKPANLMLTPDGVVKLLDLGLARLVQAERNEKSSTMTVEGAIMGTPDYIAPEQALESHTVDIRADLYSLGCTLYFLLTGQVPFPGRLLTDKLLKHQLYEPQPIEQLRPDVSSWIAGVARKLMAKRPVDRYQSPAELAEVLATRGELAVSPSDEAETVVQRCPTVVRPIVTSPASAFVRNEPNTESRLSGAPQRPREHKYRWLRYGVGGSLALLLGIPCLLFLLKPSVQQPPQEDTERGIWKDVRPNNRVREKVDEAWLAEVVAMPAEQQIEAVAAKLKECNPGFDGKVTHTIQDGVVTELQLLTDKVTDISPVRALVGLRRLSCGGTRGEGKLHDLSPLKGMNLTTLVCAGTRVEDLSPLKGMQLKELNVWYTPVSDLAPLQGMPLTILSCGGTKVAELSPLKGMKLDELNFWGTPVSDLSPLKGMKLTTLACGSTRVSDLSPLQGMKLKTLHFDHTPVSDLSPLRDMKLTCLSCEATRVLDLSPLQAMPLKTLWCDVKAEQDREILRSIKTLETINGKPAGQLWKDQQRK